MRYAIAICSNNMQQPLGAGKEALYGSLDPTTLEWTDGLFTKVLREVTVSFVFFCFVSLCSPLLSVSPPVLAFGFCSDWVQHSHIALTFVGTSVLTLLRCSRIRKHTGTFLPRFEPITSTN